MNCRNARNSKEILSRRTSLFAFFLSVGAPFILVSASAGNAESQKQRPKEAAGGIKEQVDFKGLAASALKLRKAIPDLVRIALGPGDQKLRTDALASIFTLGIRSAYDPEEVCRIIGDVIRKGDRASKLMAFQLLFQFGTEGEPLIPMLIRLLRLDNELRPLAARALGLIGVRPGVTAELLTAYEVQGKQDANLRAEAGLALARLRVRRAIGGLLKDMKSQNEFVRLNATKGLGLYPAIPAAAVDALCTAAKDNDRQVRAEAITSLSKCGSLGGDVANVMAIGLVDHDERVRFAAVRAVERTGIASKKIIETLLRVVQQHEKYELAREGMNALIAAGAFELPTLERILRTGDFNSKLAVAKAMARVSERGVRILVDVMSTEWGQAADAATLGLGEAYAFADVAEPALLKALGNKELSFHALIAVARLGCDKELLERPLTRIIEGEGRFDQATRKHALMTVRILHVRGRRLEKALAKAAKSKDSDFAADATMTLRSIRRDPDE